jgi:hypothetical protein
MNVLVCISSKSPNPLLYQSITSIYNNQINTTNEYNYKICVIDSASDDFSFYDKVKMDYPEVELLFIKNKNYEYGAWKYAITIYPDYDIYFCIQDSIIINSYIELRMVDDNTVYTTHHHSGFHCHPSIKPLAIEYLQDSGLDYNSIIETHFNLAQHSSFIISNKVIKDMFNTLIYQPINKDGSCAYERIFGLYFILQNINAIDFSGLSTKLHCGRT